MFCFFINGEFKDFWSNMIGDVFCLQTINSLKWDASNVYLFYYPGIDSRPEYFEFDADKNLLIKSKVITDVEEEYQDENNQTQTRIVQVESFPVVKTVSPDVFFENGLMIKPC